MHKLGLNTPGPIALNGCLDFAMSRCCCHITALSAAHRAVRRQHEGSFREPRDGAAPCAGIADGSFSSASCACWSDRGMMQGKG